MFGSASMSTTLMRDPNTEAERAGLRPQVAARAPTSLSFRHGPDAHSRSLS